MDFEEFEVVNDDSDDGSVEHNDDSDDDNGDSIDDYGVDGSDNE